MTGFEHHTPWTEADWLALGETPDRVELIDGSLLVSPAPTAGHQTLTLELAFALRQPAVAAGLRVYAAINLRLQKDRIAIPDLVIAQPVPADQLVFDAASVPFVCEITSPSNAATDRVLKMQLYAEAAILWYLLIEPTTVMMRLFRLDGSHYVEHAVAEPGLPLHLTDPVAVTIDPSDLLPRGSYG